MLHTDEAKKAATKVKREIADDGEGSGPNSKARIKVKREIAGDEEGSGPNSKAATKMKREITDDEEGSGPNSKAATTVKREIACDLEGSGPNSKARRKMKREIAYDEEGSGPKSKTATKVKREMADDEQGSGLNSKARRCELQRLWRAATVVECEARTQKKSPETPAQAAAAAAAAVLNCAVHQLPPSRGVFKGEGVSFESINKVVTYLLRYVFHHDWVDMERLASKIERLSVSPERLAYFFETECNEHGEQRFLLAYRHQELIVRALPKGATHRGGVPLDRRV